MNRYLLDPNGKPYQVLDLIEWATGFEKLNRRVAQDKIGDVSISTIFLGFDHSWDGPPPVLWETMIFGGEHAEYQMRYTTIDAALEGHKAAVRLVTGPTTGRKFRVE